MPWLLRLATLGMALSSLNGCGNPCGKEDEEPVPYTAGVPHDDWYETTAVWAPWLHFPPGRRYDLQTGFDRCFGLVKSYVSFYEQPNQQGDHTFSETAGNMTLYPRVAPGHIYIMNDTCQEFWVRVVAAEPYEAGVGCDGLPTDGGGGADGSGGADGAGGADGTGGQSAAPE